eukprot:1092702-Prymnesium_polylepis.1
MERGQPRAPSAAHRWGGRGDGRGYCHSASPGPPSVSVERAGDGAAARADEDVSKRSSISEILRLPEGGGGARGG